MAKLRPILLLCCASCGERMTLSVRRAYEYRRRGTEPICRSCRRPPVVFTDGERERFVKWWRERSGLSERELREISLGLSISE